MTSSKQVTLTIPATCECGHSAALHEQGVYACRGNHTTATAFSGSITNCNCTHYRESPASPVPSSQPAERDAEYVAEMEFHFGSDGSGCHVSPEHVRALLRELASLRSRAEQAERSLADVAHECEGFRRAFAESCGREMASLEREQGLRDERESTLNEVDKAGAIIGGVLRGVRKCEAMGVALPLGNVREVIERTQLAIDHLARTPERPRLRLWTSSRSVSPDSTTEGTQ